MAATQWKLIASLLRPHRKALGSYGAVLTVATALPLVASILLAGFVRLATQRAAASDMVPYAIGYAATGLGAALMTVVVTWRATALAWTITNGLRYELTGQVLYADLAFHRDRTPGELVTRVDADVTAMTEFIASIVARVIAIVVLGVAATITLAIIEPQLAPALAIGLALVGWVTWAQRDSASTVTATERAAEAAAMSTAEQYLAGTEDVAALAGAAHGIARYADGLAAAVSAARERVKVQMRVQGSIRVMLGLAEILVIALGAIGMSRGWNDVAAVVLGWRFVSAVRTPVEHLTWRLQDAQGATGAAQRVLSLISERRAITGGTATLPPGPLDVRFDDVALIYDDGDETVIRDLSFRLASGRTLGLVGRTGSGKTSLIRLVLRLAEPTSGVLSIGGVDVTTVDETDLRRRVTAIPQDVQLFPGTVHDNVAMFADRSSEQVRQALDDVGLSNWLDGLPHGLDTQLASDARDDEGTRIGLSSGQAQLLSVARALLRNPSIVVLDEATSRVDPATQAAIGSALARLVKDRTSIVIAHRLETLDRCDEIMVLEHGKVVEHGERTTLAADPMSRYAQLRLSGNPESDELS